MRLELSDVLAWTGSEKRSWWSISMSWSTLYLHTLELWVQIHIQYFVTVNTPAGTAIFLKR